MLIGRGNVESHDTVLFNWLRPQKLKMRVFKDLRIVFTSTLTRSCQIKLEQRCIFFSRTHTLGYERIIKIVMPNIDGKLTSAMHSVGC